MKRVLLLVLFSVGAVMADPLVQKMPVLMTRGEGKNETGLIDSWPLSYERDAAARALRVSISDDTPNGASEWTRITFWQATLTAGLLRNDPLDGVRVSVDYKGDIDGPSAGAITCLAILQAMEGRTLPEDFAMTGTIQPDGSIGSVGGVALKIRAAIKAGKKLICIPDRERFETQTDGTLVDLYRLGEGKGVRIVPVKTIQEAYRLVNGKPFSPEPPWMSEREILALPPAVDVRVVEAYHKMLGTEPEVSADAEHWEEVANETGFAFLTVDDVLEAACWQALIGGRPLAAYDQACELVRVFRSSPRQRETIWQVGYRAVLTNALAETEVMTVGTNRVACVAKPPYQEKQRARMIAWANDCRTKVCSRIKAILEPDEDDDDDDDAEEEKDASAGFFPDGHNTEIAAQGEVAELTRLAERQAYATYYQAVLSEAPGFEEMTDDELHDQILSHTIMLFALCMFDYRCDEPGETCTRRLLYEDLPRLTPSHKVAACEKAFYQAARTMIASVEADLKEYQEPEMDVDAKDPQHAHLSALSEMMIACHDGIDTVMTNQSYNLCAQLYLNSQVLAKAAAMHAMLAPDLEYDLEKNEIGNRENAFALIRTARATALEMIAACKQAKIPCIDPIRRFELAETSVREPDCDLVTDVLENYWAAHLGAKALRMGFSPPQDK